MSLADKPCVPCKGDTPPLAGSELEELHRQLPDWEIVREHHLRREFRSPNFREALSFVNRVGELAEEQGHHPNISFTWRRVEIEVFTHVIDGLTKSDFVLAAKIDRVR